MSDHRSGQDAYDSHKLCTRCRQTLPLKTFAKKPSLSSGYDSWCRPCRAANLREWRAKRRAATSGC